MSTDERSKDHLAAMARLDSLEKEIDRQVSHAQFQGRLLVIIGFVLVVFMGVYLLYGYSQIKTVNAPMVMDNVQYQVRQALPDAGGNLEEHLILASDQYIDNMIDMSMQLPGHASEWLTVLATRRIQEAGTEIEDELYVLLQGQLQALGDELADELSGLSEAEARQLILEKVTEAFDQQVSTMMEKYRVAYTQDSEDLLIYFQHLQSGAALTREERLHRELISRMIAIVAQAHEQSEGQPLN